MCKDQTVDEELGADRPMLPSIFQIFDPRHAQLDGPSSLTLAPLHIRADSDGSFPDQSLQHPVSVRSDPSFSQNLSSSTFARATASQSSQRTMPSSLSRFPPSGSLEGGGLFKASRTQSSSTNSSPYSHAVVHNSKDPRTGPPAGSHLYPSQSYASLYQSDPRHPHHPEDLQFEASSRSSNIGPRPAPTSSNPETFDTRSHLKQIVPSQSPAAPGKTHPLVEETAEGIFSAEFKHECSHCGKRFNRPSGLRIHLTSHTGDKPFVCPEENCGRSFGVLSNMRRHIRLMHQASQEESGANSDDELDDGADL